MQRPCFYIQWIMLLSCQEQIASSIENSEALAEAILVSLNEQGHGSVLFLDDVSNRVNLDSNIKNTIYDFWGRPGKATSTKSIQSNIVPKFFRHVKILKERINANPNDTMARGLLAIAIIRNLTTYNRIKAINDFLLDGKVEMHEAPKCPCPLYVDMPCRKTWLPACAPNEND